MTDNFLFSNFISNSRYVKHLFIHGLHSFSVTLHDGQPCEEDVVERLLDVVGTSFPKEHIHAVETQSVAFVWG